VNIDAMPAGRELDALVAEKVMGWTDINGNAAAVGCGLNHNKLWTRVPDYSTDIAAAWQVVEKLVAEGRSWTFGACKPGKRSAEDINQGHMHGYHAGVKTDHYGVVPFYWNYKDTMPLAICHAALKAVGAA
jgi:hypothetical protein